MVTLVFITQIEEEEESILSEQIHSLNLKDTTSMSTMTTNTYSPVDKTQTATMASTINTNKVFHTQVYLTAAIGSTCLSTTYCTPSLNHLDPSVSLRLNYYQAQQYHETTCNKNPKSLLAIAHEIIDPKTGFPFALDGEPFSSYHKKNEYKVGNTHLIYEVIRRAQLNPNWEGVGSGNNDQPQPKSWNKSKCLI